MSLTASPTPSIRDTASVPADEAWGRFATLSPDSTDAEAALQELVESLGDQLLVTTLGAFIEPTPRPASEKCSCSRNHDDSGNLSDDDSNDEPGSDDTDQRKTYRFVLSFDHPPQGPRAGWVLGKGNHCGPGVQLPVCPPRTTNGDAFARPGGAIVLIYMHPETGAFIIQALSQKHPVTYRSGDGNRDIILETGNRSVLHMTRNHLRFRLGRKIFDYVLEFDIANEDRFIAARNNFARVAIRPGESIEPYKQLDHLPKQSHHRMHRMVVHRTLSAGAFGLVKSGVDTETGDAVAMKTIHCKIRQVPIVKNELQIAASFPKDTVGIIPILGAWCEHGNSPPCFDSPLEDIHFSMPLARCDFEHAPWESIDHHKRMVLFRQTLQGLQTIHSRGIMHRDISPRNLLIDDLQTPRAGICDFGKAKRAAQGKEPGIGPLHTVAPEVGSGPYSSAIDIWSLAYAWLWAYQKRTDVNVRTDARRQASLINTVDKLSQGGDITADFADLLRLMLSYEPDRRPTAEKALQHSAWDELEYAASDVGTECNSPRLKAQSFGPGPAKKPRLQIPDDVNASIPSTLSPSTP
ncbi:kinase-like domain-containing protein [Triangularia setosa]|uniref:EKC/KEOPS complex subunit BUD32 n=1 Tax=Triangularia setosa TaxID=2587417 RepID=A0AAN6VXL8_9PEZI|nr:kinase-like domain-containing protein [Podospora setosa]